MQGLGLEIPMDLGDHPGELAEATDQGGEEAEGH